MILEFEVPGKPFGKQRPQHGKGFTYTPKETVNFENLIKVTFQTAYPDHIPVSDAGVRMDVRAVYPIPDSWSNKKKDKAVAHLIRPKKPDWDNVGKIVSDALNMIAYHDDAQVYDSHILKEYGLKPRLEVTLEIDDMMEVES